MTDRSTKPKEGTDAELVWLRGYEAGVAQMRHDHDAGWCSVAAERDALAARLAEAERLRDEAVAALESLERRATVVSNKGAVTGPQWTKLTIGILGARNLLASIKETRDDQ